MTPTNEEIIKGNRVIAEKVEEDFESADAILIHGESICEMYGTYHESWEALMPAIDKIRDQMGLHTVWQTMKALQENYAKVGPEDFQTITDVWKAVVIYFESKK